MPHSLSFGKKAAKGPGLYSDIGKKAGDLGLSVETLSSLTKLSREGVEGSIFPYEKGQTSLCLFSSWLGILNLGNDADLDNGTSSGETSYRCDSAYKKRKRTDQQVYEKWKSSGLESNNSEKVEKGSIELSKGGPRHQEHWIFSSPGIPATYFMHDQVFCQKSKQKLFIAGD